MAGTVAVTEEREGDVAKIKFAWTSSAGGAADAVTTKPFSGNVTRAVIVPGSGDAAPTNLFDVTVSDEDGVDVLCGQGADLSNAAPTVIL